MLNQNRGNTCSCNAYCIKPKLDKRGNNNFYILLDKLERIVDQYGSGKYPDYQKGYDEFMRRADEATELADRGQKFTENLLIAVTVEALDGFLLGLKSGH